LIPTISISGISLNGSNSSGFLILEGF